MTAKHNYDGAMSRSLTQTDETSEGIGDKTPLKPHELDFDEQLDCMRVRVQVWFCASEQLCPISGELLSNVF